ncbi:hypothetical protein P8452_32716 [Trifolium repens]|nr:hypothetical protein P8452_32716 [Trifolium repens]
MLQAQILRAKRNQSLGTAKKTGLVMKEIKRELILTESEQEEMCSDLEEFLWTYDDDKPYEYYQAEAKQALEDLLSYIREKHKRLDAEAAKAKSKSK